MRLNYGVMFFTVQKSIKNIENKIWCLSLFILLNFSLSTNYNICLEGEDSNKEAGLSSSNYKLDSKLAPAFITESISTNYIVKNGFFQTINIDLISPPPVINLNAQTLDDGNIKLSWTQVVDDESFIKNYRIYRSPVKGKFNEFISEIDSNEWTDNSGLIYGVTYYYKVQAVDVAGNEQGTGNTIVTGLSKSLSSSVTTLVASSKLNGDIELRWNEIPLISYYRVYRSNSYGEKGTQVNADGVTLTGYYMDTTANGIINGNRYYYTIKVVQVADDVNNEQDKGNNQSSAACDSSIPTSPKISSSTHPDNKNNINNFPGFNWIESVDPNFTTGGGTGIKGYYYALSLNSKEDYNNSWSFTPSLEAKFSNVEDGHWYFCLVGIDNAGNISNVSRYEISIITKGIFKGTIFDNDGVTPLKDIKIDLFKGGKQIASTRTDLKGNFIFEKVEFGNYKIRIFKPGFTPFETEELSLNKDNNVVCVSKSFNNPQNVNIGDVASYPNPAKGDTITFVYYVEKSCSVYIDIYNSLGEKIITLEDTQTITGFRETPWVMTGISTGVYLYSIKLRENDSGNLIKFPIKKLSVIK
ncbi:MAG: carboxypeptidase regulatory-like domain-containing protein [Candidatus Firestonebacteria bacterium]